MECPRCSRKLKRTRTVDGKTQVIRYNHCFACGERVKTVELYVLDYQTEISAARLRAIKADLKAEQLEFDLNSIRVTFQRLQEAIIPNREPEQVSEHFSPAPRSRRSPYVKTGV